MKFKPHSNPLLIIGDQPALPGGLSRIGRDLASLACTLPQFRVAYLGRGEGNRRKFPWVNYSFHESGGWGQDHIEAAWNDFSGGEDGIILTTDDPSRRLWFSQSLGVSGQLANFLGPGRRFKKIGYFPIDSWGPNGQSLGAEGRAAVAGYDRVLAASEWGMNVLKNGGRGDADWLPHGIFMDKFHPYPKEVSRAGADWNEHDIVVGFVAANQSRKDFPVAFECAALLKREYGSRFKFWLHTDIAVRYWNVAALATDYAVGDCLEVTMSLNDDQLALRYSGCDCTILPSGAEGFGYPIAESLACGTSCIVTDYAAGQELVQEDCRVRPVTYRIDTTSNVMRAVLSGHGFANLAKEQIERKSSDWNFVQEQNAENVAFLDWENLKFPWTRWLREGLK